MTIIDCLQTMWEAAILRPLFQVLATLIGKSTVPLSEWLAVRAARRLPATMAAECERQWLADFYGLPAWLQLRSAVSLFTSRELALAQPLESDDPSKGGSDSDTIAKNSLRGPLPLIPAMPTYDALTGLANRRAMERNLARLTGPLRPRRQGLSVVMVDIDNFKSINEQLGRLAGDALLKELGRRLRKSLRGRDQISRVGSDEFTILMPNTPRTKARQLAEKLRFACEISLIAPNDRVFAISASLGISSQNQSLRGSEILCRADRALHQAKNDGKNCIREFTENP